MQKDRIRIILDNEPDLSTPPHTLPLLIDLFTGEEKQTSHQLDELCAHLLVCDACRSAAVFLLNVVKDHDHQNTITTNIDDIITRLAQAQHVLEADDYTKLGKYAETVVTQGGKLAAKQFPELASHLGVCQICSQIIEATIDSLEDEC